MLHFPLWRDARIPGLTVAPENKKKFFETNRWHFFWKDVTVSFEAVSGFDPRVFRMSISGEIELFPGWMFRSAWRLLLWCRFSRSLDYQLGPWCYHLILRFVQFFGELQLQHWDSICKICFKLNCCNVCWFLSRRWIFENLSHTSHFSRDGKKHFDAKLELWQSRKYWCYD